ncbi:MAG: class I SAM-dependent methyltransferase [Pseudomonadota bacterium]
MTDKPNLSAAYALQTPDDNRALYARWAGTYDSDFVAANDYILHLVVAEAFAAIGTGPVLDIGAGTGLCGAALAALGVGPVDGTDISPEMLDQAATRGTYRDLFAGDILAGLGGPAGRYNGIVSSGTFTHGHVGPEALDEVLRLLAPGGVAVLSVNAAHFEDHGFAAKMDALPVDIHLADVPIYGPNGAGPNAKDRARLVTLRPR